MSADPATGEQKRFRVLDLVVDLERGTVRRGEDSIDLPPLSFRLLACLIAHAPDPVDKDKLIREVWGDVVVGDETLAQRVRLLRQALGEDSQSPRYLASVRGQGYRLKCDAVPAAEDENRRRPGYGLAAAAGLVAALFALTALWMSTGPQTEVRSPPAAASIAVLPFADLSAEQDYGYFADGMHDELLARLADIEGLRVASRTSVEPYRSSRLGITEIAGNLRVANVIEGSVRVDEDRIRITVQLIEAATDRHLWADSFDRSLSVQNIFSIQEEVARQIAKTLQREYANVAEPQPVQLPTDNLDAYTAFLLGSYHMFRLTPDDLELAVAHLERAVALDPAFAEAYAILGYSYSFLGTNYGNRAPTAVYPKAKEAALRAIALDGSLSNARTLYADILTWYDWDFEAAEREYLSTLKHNPLNNLGYALFLSTQERHEEAVEHMERRLEVNPEDPWTHVNAAWRYLNARRYDRAIEEAELAGSHADARSILGRAWLARGDAERAIAYFEADLAERGRLPLQLSNLAGACFAAGQRARALALLGELEAMAGSRFVSPALPAYVYFAAGDADSGFAALEEAVDARARDVIFLRVWEVLDTWRDDPRYEALIETIGFTSPR